jgi:cysteine desulfurase / selenocysteine lyase
MSMINTTELIDLFPVKKKYLYFNYASDGPLPVSSKNAIIEAVEESANEGLIVVPKQIGVFEDIRHELSILFKSKKENFSYARNTSEGVLLALLAINIKEDENYIVAEDAFPTTVKIMDSHCKGQMRTVEINSPIPMIRQLESIIDSKTKAIVLDWAHFFTGKIIDIEAITQMARKKNIFTIIDGIQAAGSTALELDKSNIDFFITGGHKWLLSPQGSGFIYVSEDVWNRIPRKSFGWLGYDWKDFSDFTINPELREGASVMEYGTRPYIPAVGFRETLRLFNRLGISAIEKYTRELSEYFAEQIREKGFETIQNEKMAPIVSFKSPRIDSRELMARLKQENVVIALRNGFIRSGFHFINEMKEVQKFIDLLD